MSLLHKTEKQNKNDDQLIRLMTPMIAGILACTFFLVSMTWAWFTASLDTESQTIQSATRSTDVAVYEISQPDGGSSNSDKTLLRPQTTKTLAFTKNTQATQSDASEILAGEALEWELSPEKEYEIVMTGSGTASTGYCEVELSQIDSSSATSQITKYKTDQFEKDQTLTFIYKTGGFSSQDGVTQTQWRGYVENTDMTLTIASHWGKPAEEREPQVALMSLRGTAEEIMLLSDGDVLGLAPIPCPEAKAETEVELEGFETEECAEISAEKDYKVSLTLKEGYEMPSQVVVNIDGKDYIVSTNGNESSNDAPYYDAKAGVLTVPATLLSDGTTVSVKATASQIPVEEIEEDTEKKTEENETEDEKSSDTSSDNDVAIDNPIKKEEDGDQDIDEPVKTPIGSGDNDDDDDEDDNSSGGSSNGNSSSDNNEEITEDEKADVKLNLSQLTINLEETKIPTNADLVLTLSAKEEMELPEKIVITLDKTIRDEDIEDKENENNEEIIEDKTEYIINTDGEDNPEGFEFDAESGELTISSELLENVREITIADTEENEADEDEEKATLTFEVKNLTFDFADDEIVTDEDVVITFTAGEGYELPETIIITIDGEEYIIYTTEEEGKKNPEGITFDIETGTLTISKDLLEDAKEITITAEGNKKDDESEDNDTTDNGNESEGGEGTDKKPEDGENTDKKPEDGENTDNKPDDGTDTPDADDKTENEGETGNEGGDKTESTQPETNPDNTGDDNNEGENNSGDTGDDNGVDSGEENGGDNGEDNGVDDGETETTEPGTEPTNPTTPDTEDSTNIEQGGENAETEENGKDSTENELEETTQPTPDTESAGNDETAAPTEPVAPSEPSEPVVTPETPKTEISETSEPATGGNDDDNGETESVDVSPL